MRSVLVVLAAIVATVVAGAPAQSQNIRKPQSIDRSMLQRIAAGREAANGQTKVYVVQMADQPTVAYAGGVSGFAKSAPKAGERYDARSSQAQMYAARIGAQQDALLARIGASQRKIYSYRHAMNGFAARLTATEVAKLRKDKSVLNVWEDRRMKLDTNFTPTFLGLNRPGQGLWKKKNLRGEGVIIGMIDTGIVQEHPSLDDTGMPPPPAHWAGICQAGEGFEADDCNNKLIGARYFVEGFLGGDAFDDVIVPGDFESPRDSDGHGTHTATTAAGRETVASLFGTPLANVSGMAPNAFLAIYKACWQDAGDGGCANSDTAAAVDAAVADGVDVISYSIGTAAVFNDPTDIAFLFARDAGVFVSRSAGNEGPGPSTTGASEPWDTAVAASTTNGPAWVDATRVNSPASLAGDYGSFEGATTAELAVVGPITDNVVAANPLDACTPIAAVGTIVLIERGGCAFDVKLTNAVAAGADAALVFTNEIAPGVENPKTVMGGDLAFPIPGVMIDRAPGLAIRDALAGGTAVNATLQKGIFIKEQRVGGVMADFSSRGPNQAEGDWIKPDVTAPGVQIFAGHTPEPNNGSVGGFFQYLQGTSMSTPHVAGIAALLIQSHPDWTPGQVKSALMTTAGRRTVVKEDGVTPTDPFDLGSGHIEPNRADNPGLTYDAGFFDFVAASCGTASPLVGPDFCGDLEAAGFSLDPADLNLPSIGVSEVLGQKTIHRTVTNVGPPNNHYKVQVKAPPGFTVDVNPKMLKLAKGESATYEVTITNISAPPGEWRFGRIQWDDSKGHLVRSPLAVRAQALSAPEGVTGEGESGSASFEVGFGYNGAYSAGVHGLDEPFLTSIPGIPDDPDNTFDFGAGDGEVVPFAFPLPAGTAYAQWTMFDEYVDGAHDFDIYLFYCPPDPTAPCPLVGQSAGATSAESIGLKLPEVDDPSTDADAYILIVHAFETAGGAPAGIWTFDWAPGADQGNMTASGPSSAAIGATGTIDVDWAGLFTGPGEKQVGAISHNDGTGPLDVTSVNIANDAGLGYDDLCAIAPPGFCVP